VPQRPNGAPTVTATASVRATPAKRHYKPGALALQQIRKYQGTSDLLLLRTHSYGLVRYITMIQGADTHALTTSERNQVCEMEMAEPGDDSGQTISHMTVSLT
jgi:hypothetical protein